MEPNQDIYSDWEWFKLGRINTTKYRLEFVTSKVHDLESEPTNSHKAFKPNSFILLFIGYTISQLPWAFMGSKAGLLANLWFKPTEISLATSIASTGQILGMGLGFFLPPFIIKEDSTNIYDSKYNQSRGDSFSIELGTFLHLFHQNN